MFRTSSVPNEDLSHSKQQQKKHQLSSSTLPAAPAPQIVAGLSERIAKLEGAMLCPEDYIKIYIYIYTVALIKFMFLSLTIDRLVY